MDSTCTSRERRACQEVDTPGHPRLIFRSAKNSDRVDAEKIATLLFFCELPRVHVPGLDTRAWRELIVDRDPLDKGLLIDGIQK